MRYREFKKEARTDEILPAIAGGVAKVGAGIAKAGAKAVGGAVAKVGAKAVKAVGSAGKSMATKVAGAAADKLSQELIKRGSKIPMPTEKGAKEFEIDDVNGDEVTLVNPDASKAPEEPEKVTYKKQDIDTIVQGLPQGAGGNNPNATIGNQNP